MQRRYLHIAVAIGGMAVLGLASRPAAAQLVINPIFDSSITSDPNAAAIEGVINNAITNYEHDFNNPITVGIYFQEMASGLGQSNTVLYKLPYLTVITALHADAQTANDATALSLLPIQANNPVTGSTNINVKTANIRALGIPGSFPSGLIDGVDGIIGLNTNITDIGSPGTTGQYSLMATTEHEIDEVLGLGSDDAGVGFFTDPAMEDLFRYDSIGNRSYTANTSAKSFFSINATTDLAQFDNQGDGGDWGDWQSLPLPPLTPPEVQDAFATPGAHPALGVELTALDVIGYNLTQQQTPGTPEPGTLAMLFGTGVFGAAAAIRRKRSRA